MSLFYSKEPKEQIINYTNAWYLYDSYQVRSQTCYLLHMIILQYVIWGKQGM